MFIVPLQHVTVTEVPRWMAIDLPNDRYYSHAACAAEYAIEYARFQIFIAR